MDPAVAGGLGAVALAAVTGIVKVARAAIARRADPPSESGESGALARERAAERKRSEVMAQQIHDLHDWHDVEDHDGVKRWYNKRSTENAIAATAEHAKRAAEASVETAKASRRAAESSERSERLLAELVAEHKKSNSHRPPE